MFNVGMPSTIIDINICRYNNMRIGRILCIIVIATGYYFIIPNVMALFYMPINTNYYSLLVDIIIIIIMII